ncbi:helix-turn-helix domain-containing protein [Streptomyces sp. CBMA29]|uniref:helix-turn-helix domain-containing protein n=1 Tax=Streptomyces sp. CBMA29 TaxID=1896314 RepID=UPI001661E9EE|nr:transcriptional regulator [Streptomyces sp. CBMA29]MBD0737873.1 transcriptional regulator [Streptomyces sp. CBMA29]
MTSEERRAFGARVARLRSQRGLTQAELARRISRTASWMSQVERGVQPVVRLDVLRLLADGLGVSVNALQPGALEETPAPPPTREEPNDLDATRLLISGHPALDALFGAGPDVRDADLAAFEHSVDTAWDLAHAARFTELNTVLAPLLPRLEAAARTAARPEAQAALHALLGRLYQAVSAAFARQGESDAAWVAADRAIRSAEQSEQPYAVGAAVFRLTQAFMRAQRLDQAEHAATSAVGALHVHIERERTTPPEAWSVLGALHLVLALVHARAGRRTEARAEITKARETAGRLGENRNDFNLEFGPTNVEVWAIAVAIDLGDAGEALDIGQGLDTSGLSTERRSRLLIDLARAHTQRRQVGEALACLLSAEELAAESVRASAAARDCVRELLLVSGRTAPSELLELARRSDSAP